MQKKHNFSELKVLAIIWWMIIIMWIVMGCAANKRYKPINHKEQAEWVQEIRQQTKQGAYLDYSNVNTRKRKRYR